MALIQSRFIYYAIFAAAQRQEICLKFSHPNFVAGWLGVEKGEGRNRKRNTQLQETGTAQNTAKA